MTLFAPHSLAAANALCRIGTEVQAEAVMTAGSLGEAVLLLEHHYGGVSEEDFSEGQRRLGSLEGDWRRIPCNGIEDFLDRSKQAGAFFSDVPRIRQSVSLVDFLLKRPDWSVASGGSCFPIAVVAAHLGAILDVPFEFVLQINHINLFHPPSASVLDLTDEVPYRTTLPEIRKTGGFGEKQEPGPASAAIAAGFLNLAVKTAQTEEQARRLLDIALAVYPEFPVALTARALIENDPNTQESFLAHALALHPRYIKALELLSRLYEIQGRHEEFRDVYRRLLREKSTAYSHSIVAGGFDEMS